MNTFDYTRFVEGEPAYSTTSGYELNFIRQLEHNSTYACVATIKYHDDNQCDVWVTREGKYLSRNAHYGIEMKQPQEF